VGEDSSNLRRSREQVLDVVEQQEKLFALQVDGKRLADRLAARVWKFQRTRDCCEHQLWIAQRCQRYKPDAVAKITPQIARYL
jgi:hypothetical protein